MKYIVVAHKLESRPIFNTFTCKKARYDGIDIYTHQDFKLIHCGNGLKSATAKTKAFLQRYSITQDDKLINIGICGAPKSYALHQFVEVGVLHYKEREQILHVTSSHILESLDAPKNSPCDTLVDMEAFGIYEASKAYFSPSQMHFYKMVSDFCNADGLTKAHIQACIDENVKNIQGVIDAKSRSSHRS